VFKCNISTKINFYALICNIVAKVIATRACFCDLNNKFLESGITLAITRQMRFCATLVMKFICAGGVCGDILSVYKSKRQTQKEEKE